MEWKPSWKKGEVIRQVMTGKPYLVIHIFSLGTNDNATAVVDLENGISPCPLLVINQRDYDHYVRDLEMNQEINGKDVKWIHTPLPVIDP